MFAIHGPSEQMLLIQQVIDFIIKKVESDSRHANNTKTQRAVVLVARP